MKKKKAQPRPNELTDHQIKIVKLICKEQSPGEISQRLNISMKTFFNHRAIILKKIKAKGNIGIYKYAVKKKLITS